MSAGGPESIPTSEDPKSRRPTKKRAMTPVSAQAASVDALFARPDQDIRIPASSSGPLGPRRPAPPEIVTNVQGSSAGAGSGEFHVYKAARRREYERLREMDAEVRREKDRDEFEKDKAGRDAKDEERTRKNREKREKMKARKAKKGKGAAGGTARGGAGGGTTSTNGQGSKDSVGTTAQGVAGDRNQQERNGAEPSAEKLGDGASREQKAQSVGLVIHDED